MHARLPARCGETSRLQACTVSAVHNDRGQARRVHSPPSAPPPAQGFAVVKRVAERATGRAYAVKIMSLPPVGTEPGDNESTR
jgi:hypothetical protein